MVDALALAAFSGAFGQSRALVRGDGLVALEGEDATAYLPAEPLAEGAHLEVPAGDWDCIALPELKRGDLRWRTPARPQGTLWPVARGGRAMLRLDGQEARLVGLASRMASADDYRPLLGNVWFQPADGRWHAVATDGCRLMAVHLGPTARTAIGGKLEGEGLFLPRGVALALGRARPDRVVISLGLRDQAPRTIKVRCLREIDGEMRAVALVGVKHLVSGCPNWRAVLEMATRTVTARATLHRSQLGYRLAALVAEHRAAQRAGQKGRYDRTVFWCGRVAFDHELLLTLADPWLGDATIAFGWEDRPESEAPMHVRIGERVEGAIMPLVLGRDGDGNGVAPDLAPEREPEAAGIAP